MFCNYLSFYTILDCSKAHVIVTCCYLVKYSIVFCIQVLANFVALLSFLPKLKYNYFKEHDRAFWQQWSTILAVGNQ